MVKNSSINLSVTNGLDGFTLSGNYPTGRALTLTSGNVTLIGGGVIQNGQLLIGNASGNSYDQGSFTSGPGISITSGQGSIVLNASNYPLSQNIDYATGITPQITGYNNILNIGTLTGNLFLRNPTGAILDGYLLTFRFVQDNSGRYIRYDNQYAFGTDITTGLVPTTSGAKFQMGTQWNATDSKWRVIALVRGF